MYHILIGGLKKLEAEIDTQLNGREPSSSNLEQDIIDMITRYSFEVMCYNVNNNALYKDKYNVPSPCPLTKAPVKPRDINASTKIILGSVNKQLDAKNENSNDALLVDGLRADTSETQLNKKQLKEKVIADALSLGEPIDEISPLPNFRN